MITKNVTRVYGCDSFVGGNLIFSSIIDNMIKRPVVNIFTLTSPNKIAIAALIVDRAISVLNIWILQIFPILPYKTVLSSFRLHGDCE